MTPVQSQLLEKYFDQHLDEEWRQGPFTRLDGMEVVEVLWPLNYLFRPHLALVTSLPYVPRLEKAADAAIEAYVFGGDWTTSDPPANVWRVLLERHIQAQMVALANYSQGQREVMPLPLALPEAARLRAAMLFFHYAMKLPFPVTDRTKHTWPETGFPGSLSRH